METGVLLETAYSGVLLCTVFVVTLELLVASVYD